MTLHYLMYASCLTATLDFSALDNLLEVSQTNNAASGLTGFLHIENQIVLQYLEGPENALQQTVARIRNDPRHRQFSVISEGPLEHRHFDRWNMALVENATLSLFDLTGNPSDRIGDVARTRPGDLISFLAANASFLRDRPSIV